MYVMVLIGLRAGAIIGRTAIAGRSSFVTRARFDVAVPPHCEILALTAAEQRRGTESELSAPALLTTTDARRTARPHRAMASRNAASRQGRRGERRGGDMPPSQGG